MRVGLYAAFIIMFGSATSACGVCSEWKPDGLSPTNAALGDVLAANARASTRPDAPFSLRRESWTYRTGTHQIAVGVVVRDADYRTSLDLDGQTYTAGRLGGVHWRGEGNGAVHGVEADLQGDPLDRAPRAVFAIDPATCTVAGEARLPAPAWVVQNRPDGDKAAFLYVDKATGTIVREVMRDGKRTVTTIFDRFEPFAGALRARHWQIDDTVAADALDVTVDAIEPGPVPPADVAIPGQRVFGTAVPPAETVTLDTVFHGARVDVHVDIDGSPEWFVLDTGTTSITIDPELGRRHGGTILGHAVLKHVSVGPLAVDRISALTVPFVGTGILGFDFFFGHVVEIDYLHKRVRVLSPADASAVFADPRTNVIAANVDQGLPLVAAAFGIARSDVFALDTGSPHVYVMKPFIERYAQEIASHWTPQGRPYIETYLEGGIEVQPYRVARFAFGLSEARDLIVGGQVPSTRTDDLAIPFDGIIGTDILQNFDMYLDYDHARIGLRH